MSIFFSFSPELVSVVKNDNRPLTAKLWHTDCNESSGASYLMNGCHILVTTPIALLKAILVRKWTHLNRTCHLVFVQAQSIFETHEEDVAKIMSIFQSVHSTKKLLTNQVIVMATAWTAAVEQFFRKFMWAPDGEQIGPVIAFSNFLEAAIYGQVDTRPHALKTGKDKLLALESILKANQSVRILVLCKDASSARSVEEYLRKESKIETYTIAEDMEGRIIDSLMEKIRANEGQASSPRPVILSDRAFVHIEPIDTCLQMVHFDFPDHSKTVFAQR